MWEQSQAVGNGRLVFPADLSKGREERKVPLEARLYPASDAIKGNVCLLENYLPGR